MSQIKLSKTILFPFQVVRRPRYVRINTNLLTTSDAVRSFQDEGYNFIRCTSGSYNDYLSQIQGLTEYDFTQDYHVKMVYVFPPGTRLHEHELYLENKIILQDKATTMAVHLLAPPQGSVILDMCAAPGMKTTQCAAYIRNEGKIYAVERDEKRYQTLCDFVSTAGCKCVETVHKDSLEIKRGDYDDVEYILLDPSCSGSGMDFSVHNYIEPARLAKLTSLQEKFLKHAMNSFPKAKRIVYSTCSLYPEENERVVTNTVKVSRAKWRVQDVKELLKGQWNNFGSNMYGSIGVRCMYAKPESDLTTGFFLAVLDRDEKDMEKCLENEAQRKSKVGVDDAESEMNGLKKTKKKKKDKESVDNEQVEDVPLEDNNVEQENESRKSKKKKKKHSNAEDSSEVAELTNEVTDVVDNNVEEKSKSRKKKKKRKEIDSEENSLPLEETPAEDKETKKKRKRKESQMVEENNITCEADDVPKKKKRIKS